MVPDHSPEENVKALYVELSQKDLTRLNAIAPQGMAAGTRYPEAMMRLLNQ